MKTRTAILTIVLLALAAQSADARMRRPSQWRFQATPYFWMTGWNGDVTVGGESAPVDFDFGKIFDSLTWGFTVHFEAQKRNKAALLDISYRNFTPEEDGRSAEIDILVVEGAGAFVMIEPFEVIVGARYFRPAMEVKEDQAPVAEGHRAWVDPFIGGRYTRDFARSWSLSARGDLGGFGVGSEFAWNALAAVHYHVIDVSFSLGYRIWGVKYKTDSGDERFEYDVVSSGPGIGITFRF